MGEILVNICVGVKKVMINNKEYKITKASYSRLIGATFECVIINKIVNKPPIWFQEFEKRNDARWAENDARWAKQEEFNKHQEQFNKSQLEFNKRISDFIEQQVKFNKHVIDVFQRNNLK